MRRTAVSVVKRVDQAELGKWKQSRAPDLAYGLVPFLKGREDFQVLYRTPELLSAPCAVELSGYGVEKLLRKASALEVSEETESSPRGFAGFARDFQPVVSFPPDLAWLAREYHVERTLRDSIARTLPASSLSILPEHAAGISARICEALRGSAQKHAFWNWLTARNRETSLTYSRLLIEYAVTAAARARARAFGGIVPCVDLETPGSVAYLHRMNVATAAVVRDRLDHGLAAPPYFYTVALNPGVIVPDTPSKLLDAVVRSARAALSGELSDFFDGIQLAVRGLSRISMSAGRVNVVRSFVSRMSDVARAAGVPLWWSRSSVAGFSGRDRGASFGSFSMNLGVDDVYADPGGSGDVAALCGKVFNPVQRAFWGVHQVRRAMDGPDHGLPDLGYSPVAPTELELGSPPRYRVQFSKPYSVGAFRYLGNDYRVHLDSGERRPGEEYLQTFESPFCQWGAP